MFESKEVKEIKKEIKRLEVMRKGEKDREKIKTIDFTIGLLKQRLKFEKRR